MTRDAGRTGPRDTPPRPRVRASPGSLPTRHSTSCARSCPKRTRHLAPSPRRSIPRCASSCGPGTSSACASTGPIARAHLHGRLDIRHAGMRPRIAPEVLSACSLDRQKTRLADQVGEVCQRTAHSIEFLGIVALAPVRSPRRAGRLVAARLLAGPAGVVPRPVHGVPGVACSVKGARGAGRHARACAHPPGRSDDRGGRCHLSCDGSDAMISRAGRLTKILRRSRPSSARSAPGRASARASRVGSVAVVVSIVEVFDAMSAEISCLSRRGGPSMTPTRSSAQRRSRSSAGGCIA